MNILCQSERPIITCKQNGFVLELLWWNYDQASLFRPPSFLFLCCVLKDIIEVRSDCRMNQALQRTTSYACTISERMRRDSQTAIDVHRLWHAITPPQFGYCPGLWPARVWNASCKLSTLCYRSITFQDLIVFLHFIPNTYSHLEDKSFDKKAPFEIQPTWG